MRTKRADRGSWRVMVIAVVVGLAVAAWAAAQAPTCITLDSQACLPTFGDSAQFAAGFECYAKRVVQAGIMPGCGGDKFCPGDPVTRADMAVFLENAKHYDVPFAMPPAVGTFADVPASFPLACWIEQFYRDGITAGCGGGNYCPTLQVTRAEMAVFILKTRYGSGYTPPPCTGIFGDVNCPNGFAVNWVEDVYAKCITAGCQLTPPLFCPTNPITRQEMAVFLWKAFLRVPSCGLPCTGCAVCS